MKGIPQGRYTKEFREEAVKLITEEKLSLPEAARRLSLPASTLGNWVKQGAKAQNTAWFLVIQTLGDSAEYGNGNLKPRRGFKPLNSHWKR